MRKTKKWLLRIAATLLTAYFLLLIPDRSDRTAVAFTSTNPYVWNRDTLWKELELQFRLAKSLNSVQLDSAIYANESKLLYQYNLVKSLTIKADDSTLFSIENDFFHLAPYVAVKPEAYQWFLNYYTAIRKFVKAQSSNWNMQSTKGRSGVYAALYGMRAATEEVLLQYPSTTFSPAILVKAEPSVTPVANIFGLEVHSGDMLVSRGGAEVSALISRGNDYPGNFSHVALLYVDEQSQVPYLIEAHIEKGVAVSTLAQYEADKKLRFMILRPRADLPSLVRDPMLPHKAACAMYKEAFSRHIPYDFKMNFYDSSSMFCSEVASYAYKKNNFNIWQSLSTISSPGVVNWLHDFGVENFVTQMPSDLEYDPQLSVVAEWRDPETLYKDHLDNAVMDAMLEKANAGESISYNCWMLPIVRCIKGYCLIKNLFGTPGIIPEGMSATRALKNQTFVAMHVQLKNATQQMADEFLATQHYKPPYWVLLSMANKHHNSENHEQQ